MVCSSLTFVRRLVAPALFLALSLGSHAIVSAQTLPTPWQSADVGSPSPAGSAAWASGRFSIKGGGPDIGGTFDAFTFVFQTLTGDGGDRLRGGQPDEDERLGKGRPHDSR